MSTQDESIDPSAIKKDGGAIADYIKDGGGWDVGVSAWALAHGVPIPPQIVKRVRVGVGRLIDGGFDLAVGFAARKNDTFNFNAQQQQKVVQALATAGRNNLAKTDSELADAVARSLLNEHSLVFENRAAIGQSALDELAKNPPPLNEEDTAEMDPDWLNLFADLAGRKSTPEMQSLFAKILAGEIRRPGTFSPMAMNVLANLTQSVARKFQTLCTVAFYASGNYFVLVDVFPEFMTSGIPELQISYADVLVLRQYQLLGNDIGTGFPVAIGFHHVFMKNSAAYVLTALASDDGAKDRRISVASFTTVGLELYSLLQSDAPDWLEGKFFGAYKAPTWAAVKAKAT